MRLVHLSDTHLGFTEFSRVDPATGMNAREADVYDAFDRAIQKTLELDPDLVVHAGDLFHTPRPSNRAIVKGLGGLKRLVDHGIPVIAIAGNHSTPRVASTGSIFEMFGLFGARAACGARCEQFRIQDTLVQCIPHEQNVEELRHTLSKVRPDAKARYNVLALHCGVRGSGEDYSLGEFNELLIAGNTLRRLSEFDYIALGHYHRHMKVAPNAFYSGSPERFSFREAGYPKGLVEVDLQNRKPRFHPLVCREMVSLGPVNCRRKNTRAIMSEVEKVVAAAKPLEGKIVRLQLDALLPTTWFEIDQRQIRNCTGDAFEFRIEKLFAESKRDECETATIGGLATEFAAFIEQVDIEPKLRGKMKNMGERYLARAEEELAE